jgi:hypothetical protein
MSAPQTIRRAGPGFRTRQAARLTALGVLIAAAVSIAILALTSAHHITTTSPLTPFQAASSSVSRVNYVGTRGHRYWCMPEKICIRVR